MFGRCKYSMYKEFESTIVTTAILVPDIEQWIKPFSEFCSLGKKKSNTESTL